MGSRPSGVPSSRPQLRADSLDPAGRRQCNGRVHSNDPDNVDDERDPDSFCDVRFDRVQGKSKQVSARPAPASRVHACRCGISEAGSWLGMHAVHMAQGGGSG